MPPVGQVHVLRQRIDQIPVDAIVGSLKRSLGRSSATLTDQEIKALEQAVRYYHHQSGTLREGIPMATLGVIIRETIEAFIKG